MQTNFDFDVAQLADYLEDKVAGFKGPLTAEKFAGGQSNPTFKITEASGEYVLRRKPPRELRQVIDPVEKDFEKQFLDTAKAVFPHWQNLARLEGAHDMVQFLMKGMALSHMSVRKKARAKLVMTYLTAIEAGARKIAEGLHIPLKDIWGLGKVQIEIFEKTVEHLLEQPTFITMYPAEVSPLARRNDQDPHVTDRFEFFVGGREIANGFSELNDAEDQESRFKQQVAEKDAGDDEAMHFDADYIRALEYGMPPTAGEGIGIDRLVMLLTDSPSIRDVLLFPHMRPE